ncbi:MAG: hypothetical protein BGO49_10275 [Planctomycetales bacterium 71-10]|nr:MAG: hypothetical protein BGO49_10275 [Planctomycetales bacterium 71-10]
MLRGILTTATVVVGAYLIYRWFQAAQAAHASRFRGGVVNDVATWMADELGEERAALTSALFDTIERGRPNPMTKRLRRIECEFAKKDFSTYRRTVIALLDSGEEEGLVGRMACDLSRDDLPDQVRTLFNREGGSDHSFVLYDRNEAMAGGFA